MLKRKLLACGLLLLAGILLVSCAENNSDAVFNHVKTRLQLTAAQVPLVKPIFDEQMAKAAQIIKEAKAQRTAGSFDYSQISWVSKEAASGSSETTGSGEARANPLFAKLEALRLETQQKLTPILSAEQIDEYNKMANEQIEQLKKAQQNGQGGGRHRGSRRRGGFSGGMGRPMGSF